jgi:hypothetical protein
LLATSKGHLARFQSVVEGLHIEGALHGLVDEETYQLADARLADLGFLLVQLCLPDDLIEEHCVRSTRLHRSPGWAKYLQALGPDDQAVADHFRRSQAFITRRVGESRMRKLAMDTSAMDWARYASAITDLAVRGGQV